jgi:hypothetical protein
MHGVSCCRTCKVCTAWGVVLQDVQSMHGVVCRGVSALRNWLCCSCAAGVRLLHNERRVVLTDISAKPPLASCPQIGKIFMKQRIETTDQNSGCRIVVLCVVLEDG